ncbi:MAG: ATP-dependent sacrificial sulfur transferase LarE [Actinomycetota bacterium]|nr:ATP-dependent sacrificial sulfur transferase LarE [Actinomycetota bacterium]
MSLLPDAPTTIEDAGTLAALARVLRELGRVVVAFSGGADSALLAKVATDTLGREHVLCATAQSASLAPEELEETKRLAREWGLRHVTPHTAELDNPDYVRNGLDRCFHCKSELMAVLGPLAAAESATVVLGVNLDDLGEHRPGQAAAAEQGARFPLVEAGFTKALVRRRSEALGLRTFDKPAAACLASRLPHGTAVTFARLEQVARAESGLRRLGFSQLRVRHHDQSARIEVPLEDLPAVIERREAVVQAVKAAGYRYVTVDLEGFRSGNLALAALQREAGAAGA